VCIVNFTELWEEYIHEELAVELLTPANSNSEALNALIPVLWNFSKNLLNGKAQFSQFVKGWWSVPSTF
jgi:hypothetical protein